MHNQYYRVIVPDGLVPGERFTALCGGQTVEVLVPPGVGGGQPLEVAVPIPMVTDAEKAESAAPPMPPVPAPAPPVEPEDAAPPMQSANFPVAPEVVQEPADVDSAAARADSTCQLLTRVFPVSLALFVLGFVLVLSGKVLQEVHRPSETWTVWEASICAASDLSSTNVTQWVGHYVSAGLVCPLGAAMPTSQAWEITSDAAGFLAWRRYHAVLYVTTGADVRLQWGLSDASGAEVVPRTTANVPSASQRRRLARVSPFGAADLPVVDGDGAAQRRLLKAGGSGSGGGGGSGGSSSGSSGYGAGRGGGRAASSSSASSSVRSYRSSARATSYGRRGSRTVLAGAYMGSSVRRRSSRSGTNNARGDSTEGEPTNAEEDLDRIELTDVSFETPLGGGRFPLKLSAFDIQLTTPARLYTNAPYLFLAFFTVVSPQQLVLFDVGVALWALGVALISAVFLVNVIRYARHRPGDRKTKWLVFYTVLAAIIGCFFAGCVAASSSYTTTESVGIVFLIGALVAGFTVFTRNDALRPKGLGANGRASILGAVLLVGMTLTLCFAVAVDAGWLPYYIGVGVGMMLTCAALCGMWHLVAKSEHVRR